MKKVAMQCCFLIFPHITVTYLALVRSCVRSRSWQNRRRIQHSYLEPRGNFCKTNLALKWGENVSKVKQKIQLRVFFFIFPHLLNKKLCSISVTISESFHEWRLLFHCDNLFCDLHVNEFSNLLRQCCKLVPSQVKQSQSPEKIC
jgi:hypothetical protein